MNKIENDDKNINNEIFSEYFKYQISWFLTEDLSKANQAENEKIVNQVNDPLIDLRIAVVNKNENPDKVINIFEKIFNFNKPQKGETSSSKITNSTCTSDSW